MEELVPSGHYKIKADPRSPIVHIIRTEEPFQTATEVTRALESAGRLLDELGRKGRSLLFDTRVAQFNNTEDFEDAIRRGQHHFTRGYQRIAFLVRTAVGSLQVKRMIQHATTFKGGVFQDEGAARAFLLAQDGDAEGSPPSGITRNRRPSSYPPELQRGKGSGRP